MKRFSVIYQNELFINKFHYFAFQGIMVDFPPNKLKQGCGKHAVYVLNSLADKALEFIKFKWNKQV